MSDEPTADRDVLANLPRTRPARRSAKRDTPAAVTAGAPKPKPKPATAKPKPATAKPKPATAKPKPAAAKPKPAAAKPKRKAATLTPPMPTAERADAPPPAGYAVPEPDPHPRRPDLFTTALNAGVEIARVSVSLGLRAMRGLTELRRSDRGSQDDGS
jgi:hypothetical protein